MTSKGWETDSLSAHLQPPPPYNPRVIHCFGRWGAAGLLAGLPLTEAPPYAVPYVSFLSAALTSERRLSAVGASWRTVRPEGLRTLMQSGVKSKRSTSTHPCQAVPYCLTYIKKNSKKSKDSSSHSFTRDKRPTPPPCPRILDILPEVCALC